MTKMRTGYLPPFSVTLLSLGLLASTLVGCASLPVQEDDTLAGYRQELAKLVETGELTKDDAEKFYGIATLEVERRAKQRHQPSDPTTLPAAFVPPARKATEL
jgi:hypothetical protein